MQSHSVRIKLCDQPMMRSISAGSVVERNNSRWRSTRLSMSMRDWHMANARHFICTNADDGFGFNL